MLKLSEFSQSSFGAAIASRAESTSLLSLHKVRSKETIGDSKESNRTKITEIFCCAETSTKSY